VPELRDRLGRVIDDLRISVTDRCNFRCVYCTPLVGIPWLPKREILTYEEIPRLVRIFLDLGVHTIRLTGGEPLMRQDIEVLARIQEVFPLSPSGGNGTEPARLYRFADGRGSIGVIASVTQLFCDLCNRARLTADGQLRTCLFSVNEHDLKGLLRAGTADEELADRIIAAVWKKEPGHKVNQPDFVRPARSMSAIGG
jgi:molybdenum cofactor biosynthesis enzyme MoaA